VRALDPGVPAAASVSAQMTNDDVGIDAAGEKERAGQDGEVVAVAAPRLERRSRRAPLVAVFRVRAVHERARAEVLEEPVGDGTREEGPPRETEDVVHFVGPDQ